MVLYSTVNWVFFEGLARSSVYKFGNDGISPHMKDVAVSITYQEFDIIG